MAKVAIEQLYLETGELTRKIYNEMKIQPQQSDWSEIVKKDFEKNQVTLDEEKIANQSVGEYKNEIKVREATLK